MASVKQLEEVARVLRRDVLESTTVAGSGHPSSCLSCAEIMSVLFFDEMSYTPDNGWNPDNDEFILSKGHAAPILYAALKRAGCIKDSLEGLRTLDSSLEGHPIPPLGGWVKVASGSLGQGLGVGIGMALAGRFDSRKYMTNVLLGDSECAEGSVWEAAQLASHYKLNNLRAIVDINGLGQRGETMLAHDIKAYRKRFESFGWHVIEVDGHDVSSLVKAFKEKSPKPTVILAKTIKGKGVSFIEGKEGWHGRALSKEELSRALEEIGTGIMPKVSVKKPKTIKLKIAKPSVFQYGRYTEPSATREAYGNVLASMAKSDSNLVVLDAEVSNSTYSNKAKEILGERFVECYIAEQNMVSVALGLAVKGKKPFVSSFAAFLARAHDQLRMASISKAHFVVCGSHAGVSIGEDGASQMGLEDLGMFRSLPHSVVFAPSDPISTEKLVKAASDSSGIAYVRTLRPKTSVLYEDREDFSLGDFKILRQNGNDKVVIVAHGIAVHEALKAHVLLKKERIGSAVVDLYCIKPLPANKLRDFVKQHGNKILIVEDHYTEGGAGEAVASALGDSGFAISSLGVKATHSATKEQALIRAGIDAFSISRAAIELVHPKLAHEEQIVKKVVKKKKRR